MPSSALVSLQISPYTLLSSINILMSRNTMEAIFSEASILRNVINSGILILVIWFLRFFLIRVIKKSPKRPSEYRLELATTVRNVAIVISIIGLGFVWGSELKNFALSLVAIAAAIVIATKELILCFLGGILKAVSRPFKIGDRIEINGIRGDVIDHDFLTVTVLEIGPDRLVHQYSGKRIVLPNSWFLGHAVINEAKRNKFGLHSFTVCFPQTIAVSTYRKFLLQAACSVCGNYVEKAQSYLKRIGDIEGLEAPTAEPRVSVSFPSGSQVEFVVRVPIPTLASARTEQAIIEAFLASLDTYTADLQAQAALNP